MCLQRIVSQRNQRSLATLKEQLQKLDVHLHQNIAMQHQVHMLVRDRREMRKAAQNGAPGAGKGPVAKNPTPTPTMLVKQVLQQSTGAIASSATQSVPVQKSATQRIDDTPNELTGNIIMFIKNTVEKYMGVEDNEAIEAGRAMASSLLSQTGSQYEVVFFGIMEDYVRILVESRAHEKHDQGEESIGQYYKSMQPVMLYFASAKKCCEELLADVREENGKPTN